MLFEIHVELQAFDYVESLMSYRIRGTFRTVDSWTVDEVALPGQKGQHDWIEIGRNHPLRRAFAVYEQTQDFSDAVFFAITEELKNA